MLHAATPEQTVHSPELPAGERVAAVGTVAETVPLSRSLGLPQLVVVLRSPFLFTMFTVLDIHNLYKLSTKVMIFLNFYTSFGIVNFTDI